MIRQRLPISDNLVQSRNMTTEIKDTAKTANTASTHVNSKAVEAMYKAGAHFGFTRSRRHPTVSPYIFGAKNKIEIFNLEKTEPLLASAKEFIEKLGSEGKTILFVGGKSEARNAIKLAGQALEMPYVPGRWVGGTLSNFPEIRKRIQKFLDLSAQREKGELAKYTKKERLLIDREIDKLDKLFSGLVTLTKIPDAMFVVDSKKEHIAVKEAQDAGIPIIALCGSDCDLKEVTHPIVGNDASISSVNFIVTEIIQSYKNGASKK
jgi:small subunit ribosomal protein S2